MYYLRNDSEMRQVMGDVSLWADAPTNDGYDTGIDIAASDGAASNLSGESRYWAIFTPFEDSAKYELRNATASKEDAEFVSETLGYYPDALIIPILYGGRKWFISNQSVRIVVGRVGAHGSFTRKVGT